MPQTIRESAASATRILCLWEIIAIPRQNYLFLRNRQNFCHVFSIFAEFLQGFWIFIDFIEIIDITEEGDKKRGVAGATPHFFMNGYDYLMITFLPLLM